MLKIFIALILIIPLNAQFGDVNNRFLLAQSYEHAGELKKAKEIYEEIFKIQPHNQQFFSALNNVLVALKDYNKSIELLNNRIKSYPQDINLYGMLGCSHFLSGDEKKAGEIWLNSVKLLNQNELSFRVIANFALSVRAFEYAISLFKEAKKISQNNIAFSFDLSNLLMITMNYREAAEEYASIISSDPNQIYTVESRLQPYLSKDDVVKSFTEVLEEKNPEINMNFAYLLVILYTQSSEFEKAFNLVKILDDKQNRQGNDLFNFAQRVQQAGKYDLSLSVYDYILTKHPRSAIIPSVKLNYAKTLESSLEEKYDQSNDIWKPIFISVVKEKEKYSELINLYKEIDQLFPHSESAIEAKLRISSIYFNRLNSIDNAKIYLEEIIKNYIMSRFSTEAIISLGKICLLKNEINKAEELFNLLNTSGNRNSGISGDNSGVQKNTGRYYSSLCLFFKNDFDSAKTLLSEISVDSKDNLANDALEMMLIINSSMNDSINLSKLSEAEYSIFREDYTKAMALLKDVILDSKAFLLKDFANLRIAEILTAKNEYSEALKILTESLNENETNIYADHILFFSGEINEFGLSNYEAAIKNFEEILINYPNSIYIEKCREKIQNLRSKLS